MHSCVCMCEQYKLANPLSFYEQHARDSADSRRRIDANLRRQYELHREHIGIGSTPANLSSVSGLLLFNTAENVYDRYPYDVDPLLGVDAGEDDDQQDAGLEPPPPSLLGEAHEKDQFEVTTVGFKPKMRAIPKFDLPTSLDLPNVIDAPFQRTFNQASSECCCCFHNSIRSTYLPFHIVDTCNSSHSQSRRCCAEHCTIIPAQSP